MTTPLATPSDVEEIWRPLDEDEKLQVAALIVKASAKLRFTGRALSIDTRMATFATNPADPSALDPVIVADVVANIVKRAIVNPDGLVSKTQTVGPMSESSTYAPRSGQQIEARLEVRESDLDALRPDAVPARPTVRSIRLNPSLAPRNPYRPPFPYLPPYPYRRYW